MLISEFVTRYNNAKQKASFVEKQIKTKYLPYEQKIALAQNIIKTSMYKNINGKDVFVPDTPVRYMLFVQTVIDYYTNLEWSMGADGQKDSLGGFNMLEQNGLVDVLFTAIGVDIDKFTTVLNMVLDDEIDLNRSVVPFFDTKFQAVSALFDTFSQALDTPEIKEKISEYIKQR